MRVALPPGSNACTNSNSASDHVTVKAMDWTGRGSNSSISRTLVPAQPAAGKLEYRIEIGTPAGFLHIPEGGGLDPRDAATVVI